MITRMRRTRNTRKIEVCYSTMCQAVKDVGGPGHGKLIEMPSPEEGARDALTDSAPEEAFRVHAPLALPQRSVRPPAYA